MWVRKAICAHCNRLIEKRRTDLALKSHKQGNKKCPGVGSSGNYHRYTWVARIEKSKEHSHER